MSKLRYLALVLLVALVACRPAMPVVASVAPQGAAQPLVRNSDSVPRVRAMRLAAAPASRGDAARADVLRCTSSATDKASLLACLATLEAPPATPSKRTVFAALSPVPPSKTSWLVPAWYVNASTGNDNNTCVSSGSPCKTFAEIVSRWQTNEPQLPQATTINFLADTTESFIWRPQVTPGGSATVLCATTTTASGTLASVHPKAISSTTPLLGANISPNATGAQGLMLLDSTHLGVAWVDSVSGSVATLTQPTGVNVPAFSIFESEVNSFANGDAYTLVRPSKLPIAAFEPTTFQNAGSIDAYFAFVGHCWIPDPTGTPGQTITNLSHLVRVTESRFDTYVAYSDATPGFDGTMQNSWMAGGGAFLATLIQAGAFSTLAAPSSFSGNEDLDAIFHGGLFVAGGNASNSIGGPTYTDGPVTVTSNFQLDGDISSFGALYGNGSGSLDVFESAATVGYVSPAATTFYNTALQCDQSSFASTFDRTQQNGPRIRARTLSAAQLDTAVASGGLGGLGLCDNGGEFHDRTQATSTSSTYPEVNTLTAGGGISLSGSTGNVTISSTVTGGVSSVTGGTAISCSPTTGAVTCNNIGVTSATGSTGLGVSASTGAVTFSNTGVTSVTGTAPIAVSPTTGAAVVSISGPADLTTLPAFSVALGNGTSPLTSTGSTGVGQVLYSPTPSLNPAFVLPAGDTHGQITSLITDHLLGSLINTPVLGGVMVYDGTQFQWPAPLTAAFGGTGLSASGASGNVLSSNGSTWQSVPPGSLPIFDEYDSTYSSTCATAGTTATTNTFTARAGHLDISVDVPSTGLGSGGSAPGTVSFFVFVGSTNEASWSTSIAALSTTVSGGSWHGWIPIPATTVQVQVQCFGNFPTGTSGATIFQVVKSYGF